MARVLSLRMQSENVSTRPLFTHFPTRLRQLLTEATASFANEPTRKHFLSQPVSANSPQCISSHVQPASALHSVPACLCFGHVGSHSMTHLL